MRTWKETCWIGLPVLLAAAATVQAGLTFTPQAPYAATPAWSGANASHFAVGSDGLYIYGAEAVGGGRYQSVVRRFDGTNTVEIARSPAYAQYAYYPDAITVANGAVYWANVRSAQAGGAAAVYRTTFDGDNWTTSPVLAESVGANVYSLCTDQQHVFGVGLAPGGGNVAFCLDDGDYRILAQLPADGTGGSGFDPTGRLFAGAWSVDGDFASHMYEFSAQQIADRLSGVQSTPYSAVDAADDHILPSNMSSVMESDGARLFGSRFNATWTGTNPMAFDLASGTTQTLGVLDGVPTSVCTDFYYRDGVVFFLAKDDWGVGGEARIYQLVPEPAPIALLMLVAMLRRRRGVTA